MVEAMTGETSVGFILQSGYRLERGRPVVQLHGLLRGGGSFLLRDTRQRPCFWIPFADLDRARRIGASAEPDPESRRAMDGRPLARVSVAAPPDVPALRERLSAAGVATFEADVRFAYRYLIDRGIRGSLAIEGPARAGFGVDRLYEDPRVSAADWSPSPRLLSIDIETDPSASRVLSVALAGCGADEVLLLDPPGHPRLAGATVCGGQRELLRTLLERLRQLDPDVITGWNVVGFDLAVLSRAAERAGVRFEAGRGPGPLRLGRARGPRGRAEASVPGRVVLDGIDLVRGAFLRFDSYSLQSVACEVLGRGKTITGSGRAEEILRAWSEDPARLVEYNLNDARLVLGILRELHLVELAVERSRLTGLPLDRVGASVAAFDFLYLSALHRRGIVAPTVRAGSADWQRASGGEVLEPRPGLHRNVLVFDFRSLYPSVIRTFQIDPLGRLADPTTEEDPIVAPNGAAFRREPAILPRMLDDLFPRREAARTRGDRAADQAIKILMNSFYGVLGTDACRFASPALANAITGFGREILLWSKARFESEGYRVLYGDTDSLFVDAGVEDAAAAWALGAGLAARLNEALATHVRDRWRVESRLELRFERLYLRLLLPSVRHGDTGARKRYAGLIRDEDRTRVVFTGMEVVRRDWTELAKRVQRELYERLFADRPIEEYLRAVVADVRAGRLDDLLVYRKALRKGLADYTASTPPHVAAARKLRKRPPGRVISYVITTDGPEPAEETHAQLDREHYVQKQVRPVAEPVLSVLRLDFDRVVGDDSQLRLF